MALHVLDEANRCLGCKKPLCQQGCPIHTNIPEVIRLLKANQMDAAGQMLFENNPLTTVCSLVCNHENQCEGHCVRNRMPSHDPVHFSIIEDYISTTYANKMTAGPAPKNGMKAAVVGSGPAGLTIAVLLARWGYDVTIFDARDKIGGVMRYGIPNYRLPDSVLDDFQYRHLELKGIKVRPNTTIGKTITIDDLFRDGYKSVFIGAGLWKANAMHIKGESLGNVAFGIDYLANSKAFRLGDDVAVIGVGNSAMDCARTAIRNGARHVTCYARRDESCISASEYEVSYAKLEGVGFRFCKAPVEIRENGLICRDTVKGEDGKFTQVEGSETFYPHTGVIVSVSQGSESNLVKTTTGIETNQKGLLSVSEDGRTTREGVFAGGDAVMGARTYRVSRIVLVNLMYLVVGLSFALSGLLSPAGFLWFALFTAAAGISSSVFNAPFVSVVQTRIEAGMLGRVMSLYRSFGLLPAALGLLGTGFLAENVGLTTTFVVAGTIIVAVGAAGFFIPSVMRLDRNP